MPHQIPKYRQNLKISNQNYLMQRVTGLGGVFLKCRDKEKTSEWYQRHLGIKMEDWGAVFPFTDAVAQNKDAYSAFSLFKRSTDYFAPSDSSFMVNFRVHDLVALLAQLRLEEVEIIGDLHEEEFGKFAWVMDPEGNKIELWQQS